MRFRVVLGFAAVLIIGCASNKLAPVSGKVMLNGKPLAQATVMFSPIGKPGSIEAGEGSAGKTNENGEYSLKTSSGKNGALVGTHQVMITALEAQVGDRDTRPRRGGPPLADKVPSRYNSKTELTFDVPSGGSDKADFELASP
ncbi:MAG TPA: hypothetical protein VKU02_18885 [Gemmataceae bacterium]|nr:hypothetical protein [Gemmataceae bacterium]